jgi:hypothetical protein
MTCGGRDEHKEFIRRFRGGTQIGCSLELVLAGTTHGESGSCFAFLHLRALALKKINSEVPIEYERRNALHDLRHLRMNFSS